MFFLELVTVEVYSHVWLKFVGHYSAKEFSLAS